MTTFQDGPAKGRTLALALSPKLLRVTECRGEFDALDRWEDEARPDEMVYAYVLAVHLGTCHINRGRKGSGWYQIAEYRMLHPQPPIAVMRSNVEWARWCESHL